MRITGILFAALLVLALLPISSLAEKGSASPRRATPSNAERVKEERESDHTRSGKTATSSNAERDDVTDAGSMIGGDYSLTEQIIVSEAVRFNTADLFGTWTVDGVTTYRFDTARTQLSLQLLCRRKHAGTGVRKRRDRDSTLRTFYR